MVVYIAGPYRAETKEGVESNIERASDIAVKVLEMGHTPITPHLNFRLFEYKTNLTSEEYLKHDLKILARCDAILMIGNWEKSQGAMGEYEYCKVNNIPIFRDWRDVPCLLNGNGKN